MTADRSTTPDQLALKIAAQLGTQVELIPYDFPARGPYGATFADRDGYVVFYQRQTTPTHRAHHIAHELAHILTGTVERVGQGPPTPDVEADAELVASVIVCSTGLRADRARREPQPTDTLTRLASVLDDYVERW
ncbi:hypothetical protein QNM97_01610 [Gordonia sp. L191]|uniref:ImmA/IrrE family metallo-endopeptidase n=1 Tax=Gordonia sp. L191 TaxID=2982699 RepID=UPI0024C0B9B9|nr:ImmA/IrrE family metallo-endopeptidase [Gordonia sp. L191]WHU47739.1 hypothetical protein QNM97_01610 [Gordonia sp. L191]